MADRQPNIHHEAEEIASSLPPLLVEAERVATTVSQGVHGRRRVGQGETFWQFRRYQWGDSSEMIDWRQSAKSQPVYVRENEWEAAQSVWLWRDSSASMDYRSHRNLPTKGDRADILYLALASLLIRGGEHIAALGTGAIPRSGRNALHRLAAQVEDESKQRAQRPRSSLPGLEALPRYSHVVLIGDFFSRLEEVKAVVDGFASRGVRGHLLQVLDPAEEGLPFEGRVQFEGLEQEGNVLIGRVESIRDDYQAILKRHQQGLAALAGAMEWTFAVHRTDRSPQTALLSLFMAMSPLVRH
jgi:uncharacterized protein (DUF58 family)